MLTWAWIAALDLHVNLSTGLVWMETFYIRNYVGQCAICSRYARKQPFEPLQSHLVPNLPWNKVGPDVFRFGHYDYLITVDYHSNFFEVNCLSAVTSSEVIKCRKNHFAHHGVPMTVVSDRGSIFTSSEF